MFSYVWLLEKLAGEQHNDYVNKCKTKVHFQVQDKTVQLFSFAELSTYNICERLDFEESL